MRNSSERIEVTHAGSLPRPDALLAANKKRLAQGGELDGFDGILAQSVEEVVRRQLDAGITVPNDGEYGKSMSGKVDYGAWWSYSFQRLGGLELREGGMGLVPHQESGPGQVKLTNFAHRRDWVAFAAAYRDPTSGIRMSDGETDPLAAFPVATGPITYTGQAAVASDVAHMQAAMAAGRRPGRVHHRRLARVGRSRRQRVLRDRGGAHLRLRGRPARGVPGDRRRRADPADRRPVDRRELRPDHPRAIRRGLPAVHPDPRRGAQPRPAGHPAGPGPLPPVLGQLARAAHHRHRAQAHRRPRPVDQRRCVHVRGGQRPARARVAGLGDRQAARGQDHHPGRRRPRDQRRRAPRARRRPDRELRPPGRQGERHRQHRLRTGWSGPLADRVGQARDAGQGRTDRDRPLVHLVSGSNANTSSGPARSGSARNSAETPRAASRA